MSLTHRTQSFGEALPLLPIPLFSSSRTPREPVPPSQLCPLHHFAFWCWPAPLPSHSHPHPGLRFSCS